MRHVRSGFCVRTKENHLFLQLFGQIIARRRVGSGMTQDELAERSGVHRTYLSDIERGTRNITLLTLNKLASSLHISSSQLVEEAEILSSVRSQDGRARANQRSS